MRRMLRETPRLLRRRPPPTQTLPRTTRPACRVRLRVPCMPMRRGTYAGAGTDMARRMELAEQVGLSGALCL